MASDSKDDVELKIKDSEKQIEKASQETVNSFEPKKCTCRGVLEWYCVCCFHTDSITGIPSMARCTDIDHLSAHMFLIISIIAIVIFGTGSGEIDFNSKQVNVTFILLYLAETGVGIFLSVYGLLVMKRLFKRRLDAAKILDESNNLRRQSVGLNKNIEKIANVHRKLEISNNTTKKATDKLKEIYDKLFKFADDIDIISTTNKDIGTLLKNKYIELVNRLKAELIASERFVIETIYNSMHLQDGNYGLDKHEFKEFINKLPENYKQRFKFELGSFDKYAGGDGILDRNDLFQVLDKFVHDEITK